MSLLGRACDQAARIHSAMRIPIRSLPAAVALVLLVGAPAHATGPTTIAFSEHPDGAVIDTEYASQGVRFGKASELGAALAGAWDCGPPMVRGATPATRRAHAPLCGGRTGTVAAFAHPRRTIRLTIPDLLFQREAEVLAYGTSGALLARVRASNNAGFVAIDRAAPDVRYLAIQLAFESSLPLPFDDLVFDHLADPLTLSPRNVRATVGFEQTDNIAFLSDADPTAVADDYRARIDWGDGQSSDGRLATANGGYDVLGTHAYARTGTFTVTTTVEKSNGAGASTSSTATVVDRPDFSVSVSPPAAGVARGQSARYTIAVTPLAGFSETVSLALSGASGTFVPASVSVPGSSVLRIATTGATALGSHSLAITATSSTLSRTATATLTVTQAPSPVVAKLKVERPRPALSLVFLDARGSTGAARYRWDVTGDGRDDVECGKNTPVLGLRSRTMGSRAVRVTAVAANGRGSTARASLGVLPRPGLARLTARRSPEVAKCLRDAKTYVEGVSCAEKVVFGVVEAQGCFTYAKQREDVPPRERTAFDEYFASRGLSAAAQASCEAGGTCPDAAARNGLLDPLVARGPIRINGIDIVPSRGAAVVLFPQIERIVSSSASISIGPVAVRSTGPVNVLLSRTAVVAELGRRERAPFLSFSAATALPELTGFRLSGNADVTLVRRGSRYWSSIRVALALPAVFSLFGGSPPTGRSLLQANNDRGLVLDRLDVRVPEAHFGGIRMTDLAFEYIAKGKPELGCSRRWWKATANVFLGSGGSADGFRLAPNPELNGVAFCNGTLKSAGGEIVFGNPLPKPQLFPGIFLERIGFGIKLNPTVVVGSGEISVGQLTRATGSLLMAFPSPASPYTVAGRDVQGALARLRGRTFTTPTIAIGGIVSVRATNTLSIPLSDAFLAYSYPSYAALGGAVRMTLPGASLEAGVDGEMDVGRALFSFHGFGQVCVAGLACLVRAESWVTSTGAAACGSVAGELHPGFGYRWGDAWPTIWLVDGCKPSRYWVTVRPNAAGLARSAAETTSTFTVQRGEQAKNVRLEGVGGAPRVEVRAPGGEVVSTAGGDFASGRTIRILRQDAGRVTWIGVANGAPGTYTITTLSGSAALAEIAATRPQGDRIGAVVVRAGRGRAVRYDVVRVPGRRVTFFEVGRSSFRRIGSVTGGRGVLRFVPASGAGGVRRIVAQVQLNGIPTPQRVVARFTVAPPGAVGRPSRIELRRRAASVDVSWRPARNASGYVVVVRQRSGAQRVVRVSAGRRTFRLSGIAATQSGTVTVRALGRAGGMGAPASRRFAALRKAPTPFLPYSELGRGTRKT